MRRKGQRQRRSAPLRDRQFDRRGQRGEIGIVPARPPLALRIAVARRHGGHAVGEQQRRRCGTRARNVVTQSLEAPFVEHEIDTLNACAGCAVGIAPAGPNVTHDQRIAAPVVAGERAQRLTAGAARDARRDLAEVGGEQHRHAPHACDLVEPDARCRLRTHAEAEQHHAAGGEHREDEQRDHHFDQREAVLGGADRRREAVFGGADRRCEAVLG